MSKKPQLSIIIPAYNEEDFLPRCLESLTKQKNAPVYEVIIVDNNSSDATPRIAKRYETRLIFEPKAGVVFARQAGLEAALGNIIVSTDADTYFTEDWLANIGRFFDNNPDAAGLAGHYHFINGPIWTKIFPKLIAYCVYGIYRFFGKTVYVSAANLAFRKKYLNAYNTNHPQGGDETEVLREISKHGKVVVTLKNPVYTSARRANQGFLHSLLVTIGYYYFFNLWHTKHIGGESVIGAMPAVRTESRTAHWKVIAIQWVIIGAVSITIFSIITHHLPRIWKFSELLHLL